MALFEYKVKISGDTSNLEKALKIAEGEIQKLSDDEVLIKLNYDGNIKGFNKAFSSVLKACPQLPIQFQYDVQKELLNRKIKEISGIEFDGNVDKLKSKLEEAALEYKKITNASFDKDFSDWEKLDAAEDSLKNILKTFMAINQLDFKSALSQFSGSVREVLEDDILIDENELKNQNKIIQEVVKNLNNLKLQGAKDKFESGLSTKEIDNFNTKLADLEDRIVGIESKIGSNATIAKKEVSGLYELLDMISKYSIENNGVNISQFWNNLQTSVNNGNESIKKLLTNLGLLNEKTNELNIVNNGMVKSGGIIGDDITVLAHKNDKDGSKYNGIIELKNKLDEAAKAGVNVSRILEVVRDETSGMVLEIQQTAKGGILGAIYGQNGKDFVNTDFLDATDEQIKKLISDLQTLHKIGIGVDINTSNLFFDKEKGFSFIDLDLNPAKYENYQEFIEDFTGGIIGAIKDYYEDINSLSKMPALDAFESKFKSLAEAMKLGYAEGQHSSSPSLDAENLEHDFTDGIENGVKADIPRLNDLGKQAATAFKDGFKDELLKENDINISEFFNNKLSENNLENTNGYTDVEKQSLLDLLKTLQDVTNNVVLKTEAFEKEGNEVPIYIQKEIDSIIQLRNEILKLLVDIDDIQSVFSSTSFDLSINNDTINSIKDLSKIKFDKIDKPLRDLIVSLSNFTQVVNSLKIDENSVLYKLDELISSSEKKLKSLQKILKKANTKSINNSTSSKEETQNKSVAKSYYSLYESASTYYKLKIKSANGTIGNIEKNELDSLEKEWYDAAQGVGKYEIAISDVSSALKEANDSKDKFLTLSNGAFGDNITNFVDSINQKFNKLENNKKGLQYVDEYYEKMNLLSSKIEELNKHPLNPIDDAEINDVATLQKQITELYNKIKSQSGNRQYMLVDNSKLAGELENLERYINKNSKLPSSIMNQLKDFRNQLKQALDIDGGMTTISFNELDAAIKRVKADAEATGRTGKSFFDQIKTRITDMNSKFIGQYFSFQDLLRYAKQASDAVIQLDSNITELRKVSNATDDQLAKAFDKSTETAKELGSTISDVISITSDWARLGYNVDQAEELARVTTLFKTVGDNMEADNASQYLVSTLQGFELEANSAMSIIDKYNEVANNFAIDTAGIGEALQRSAASFNTANTNLSESIALITGTNAVVQDPDSVGTMWKTVSARIRGAKTELEDMGEETEGMVESTSKLRDLVKGMTGFDIMEDENTFKSIYDIVVGIGEEWKNLSDIDQAALLEALAGKRAGNSLSAALNNVEMIKNAYETAENSAGSAMKEQENYAKSIQYSIDQAKASLEELASTLLNSGFLKELVNSGVEFINGINEGIKDIEPILNIIGKTLNSLIGLFTKLTELTHGADLLALGGFAAYKKFGSPKILGFTKIAESYKFFSYEFLVA